MKKIVILRISYGKFIRECLILIRILGRAGWFFGRQKRKVMTPSDNRPRKVMTPLENQPKKFKTPSENRPKKVMSLFEIRAKNQRYQRYQCQFWPKNHGPVAKPVENSHDPVVKLTKKSHDPVIKPVEKSHDPKLDPSLLYLFHDLAFSRSVLSAHTSYSAN